MGVSGCGDGRQQSTGQQQSVPQIPLHREKEAGIYIKAVGDHERTVVRRVPWADLQYANFVLYNRNGGWHKKAGDQTRFKYSRKTATY